MNFICFDFETTGLKSQTNEIIEFSFIKFHENQVIAEFSSLVKPLNPIPVEITALTQIDNTLVSASPFMKDLAKPISDFIGQDLLIAYNARFDKSFLNVMLYRHQIHHHFNNYACALLLVKHALKLNYMPKLAEAMQLMKIQVPGNPNFHRASFDALVTGLIVWECVKLLNWSTEDLFNFSRPLKEEKKVEVGVDKNRKPF